jgi:AcrR family transcriptional regulator
MEVRMKAEERRAEVLAAAAAAFAEGGLEGTSTEDVARRAGISQPYIFRLFGSKRELFLAVAQRCFDNVYTLFATAAKDCPAEDVLTCMGAAYRELVSDPVALQIQMHTFAAAVNDAEVRRLAQAGMRQIWQLAARLSGAPAEDLRRWMASGMLCNMVAALGLDTLDEPWAQQVSSMSVEDNGSK